MDPSYGIPTTRQTSIDLNGSSIMLHASLWVTTAPGNPAVRPKCSINQTSRPFRTDANNNASLPFIKWLRGWYRPCQSNISENPFQQTKDKIKTKFQDFTDCFDFFLSSFYRQTSSFKLQTLLSPSEQHKNFVVVCMCVLLLLLFVRSTTRYWPSEVNYLMMESRQCSAAHLSPMSACFSLWR